MITPIVHYELDMKMPKSHSSTSARQHSVIMPVEIVFSETVFLFA